MKLNIIIVGLVGILVGIGAGYFIFNEQGSPNMMMDRANIDRHFIEQMIPHHEGAIAMANIALEKSSREDVRSLAARIIEAQLLEIDQMKTWYADWFGGAPSNSERMMMHMEGMEGDSERLLSAPDFDREFLSQMIVHHEMAIMMAEMLKAGTDRPEMKQLADQIIASQSREIEMMKGWLTTL